MRDAIFGAAVHAVDAEQCVKSFVSMDGNVLMIDGQGYDLGDFGRVVAVGAGKATPRMARALESVLGDRISTGLINTKYEHTEPLSAYRDHRVWASCTRSPRRGGDEPHPGSARSGRRPYARYLLVVRWRVGDPARASRRYLAGGQTGD